MLFIQLINFLSEKSTAPKILAISFLSLFKIIVVGRPFNLNKLKRELGPDYELLKKISALRLLFFSILIGKILISFIFCNLSR